jgi:hypothetical protein
MKDKGSVLTWLNVAQVSQAEPLQNRTDAVLVGLSVALYAEVVYFSLQEVRVG